MRACVGSYVQVLLEARDIRSSGAGIAGSCEHPMRMLGSEFSPLEAVCAPNHRATSADPLHALNHWTTQMLDKTQFIYSFLFLMFGENIP